MLIAHCRPYNLYNLGYVGCKLGVQYATSLVFTESIILQWYKMTWLFADELQSKQFNPRSSLNAFFDHIDKGYRGPNEGDCQLD